MAKKFKQGDTVKLRSGGPIMTVQDYVPVAPNDDSSTTVRCSWFVGNKHESSNFEEDSLVKTEIGIGAGGIRPHM